MKESCIRTQFSGLSWRSAWLLLSLLVLAINWCLIKSDRLSGLEVRDLRDGLSDCVLYEKVSDRVRSGENYYDAASLELKACGYYRNSLFNWRLPIYAWIFASVPSPLYARAILGLGILASIILASTMVGCESGRAMGITVAVTLAVSNAAWLLHSEPAYFMEFWSSTALFMAVTLRSMGKSAWAVAGGGLALALRELALPFSAVCCIVAWRRGRSREALAWSAVILLFLTALTLHYGEVSLRLEDVSATSDMSWIAFGGTKFLLSCCRMNYALTIMPFWCTAIYAPLAFLGLFGWPSRNALPFQIYSIICLLMLYALGKPFNFYWGWLFTPSLAIGFAWSPLAIRDLVDSATSGVRS